MSISTTVSALFSRNPTSLEALERCKMPWRVKHTWREAFLYAQEEGYQDQVTPRVIRDIMHSRNLPYLNGRTPIESSTDTVAGYCRAIAAVRHVMRDYMMVDFPDILPLDKRDADFETRYKAYLQAIRMQCAGRHTPDAGQIISFPNKENQ